MPRLSKLPTNATLTGNETIAIVQDEETRQVALAEVLIAPHPIMLRNARWIVSSESRALINDPLLNINSNDSRGSYDVPLTLMARVDAIRNPSDVLIWEDEFTHVLVENPYDYPLNFDGEHPEVIEATQYLGSGVWRFTATSGLFDATDHRVEIIEFKTKSVLATLTALEQSFSITVQIEKTALIQVMQSGVTTPAIITLTEVGHFDTNGTLPYINRVGDQFQLEWYDEIRKGRLTAHAKLYDENGVLLATSNDLTLTIANESS